MTWIRTSSLLAAVVALGLGLTACQDSGSQDKSGESAEISVRPFAPTETDPTTPPQSDTVDASGSTGVTEPDDLPAGLPRPSGKLIEVTGDTGAYVLTYRTDDPKAVLEEYRSELQGAGYTLVDVAGTFTATSGEVSVQITTSADTVVLTLADS